MMTATMKKTVSLLLLTIVALALAVPAFAATWTHSYKFNYNGTEDSHSSSFIAGPAAIDDSTGNVTITLTGPYFPELVKDGVTYYGTYSSGVTTFVFPGDDSADIPISLHVVVPPFHDTWYDLDIHWD